MRSAHCHCSHSSSPSAAFTFFVGLSSSSHSGFTLLLLRLPDLGVPASSFGAFGLRIWPFGVDPGVLLPGSPSCTSDFLRIFWKCWLVCVSFGLDELERRRGILPNSFCCEILSHQLRYFVPFRSKCKVSGVSRRLQIVQVEEARGLTAVELRGE